MKKSSFISLLLSAVLALSSIPFTAVPVSAAVATDSSMETGDKIVLTDGTSVTGFTNDSMSITAVTAPKFYRLDVPGTSSHFKYTGSLASLSANAVMTFAVKRSYTDGDSVMYARFGSGQTEFSIGDLYTEHALAKSTGSAALFWGAKKASDNKPIDLLGMKIVDGDTVVVSEGIYNNGTWSENWNDTSCKSADLLSEDAYIAVGEATNNIKRLYYTFDEAVTLEPGEYKLSGEFRPRVYEGVDNSNNPIYRTFRFAFYSTEANNSGITATGLKSGGITGNIAVANGAMNWSTLEVPFTVTETQTLKRIDIFGGTTAICNQPYDFKNLTFECVKLADVPVELEQDVENNLIADGNGNTGLPEGLSNNYGGTIKYGPGYVIVDGCTTGLDNIAYTPNLTKPIDPTHSYELSFRVRSKNQGEVCNVRLYNSDSKSAVSVQDGYFSETKKNVIPVGGEWKTVTIKISSDTNGALFLNDGISIRIQGYNATDAEAANGTPKGFSKLCLDSFVLIDLTEVYGIGAYTNLITDGDCTSGAPKKMIDYNNLPIVHNTEADGNGYVTFSGRDGGLKAVNYTTSVEGGLDATHTYRFTFKVRLNSASSENPRMRVFSTESVALQVTTTGNQYVNLTDKWQTVTFEINPDNANKAMITNGQLSFNIHGDGGKGLKSIDLDDFKLIDLTIPAEVEGNLIKNGGLNHADPEKNLEGWTDEIKTNKLNSEIVDGSGVIEVAAREVGTHGVKYTSNVELKAGRNYVLSFRIRAKAKNDTSVLRLYTETNGNKFNEIIPTCNNELEVQKNFVTITSEWQTLTFEIDMLTNSVFTEADTFNFRIQGAPGATPGHCAYYIDDLVLLEQEDDDDGRLDTGIVMMLLKKMQTEGGSGKVTGKDFVPTNLIANANTEAELPNWKTLKQTLEIKTEGGKDYLAASDITVNYYGFTYNPGITLPAGTYEFSCKLRTSAPGEKTVLRVTNSSGGVELILDVDNKWQEAAYQFTVTEPMVFSVKIVGGTKAEYIQSYDIADIKLIDVNEKAPKNDGQKVEGIDYLGNAVSEDGLKLWNAKKQELRYVSSENGGYLSMGGITVSSQGFDYVPETPIPAGKYKFTGSFRTANEGELTHIRLNFRDEAGTVLHKLNIYPTSGEWLKVEAYMTLTAPTVRLWINGGPNVAYIQPYEVSELSLVSVTKIPSGGGETSFGKAITPDQLAK